jgi:hypothetical protein
MKAINREPAKPRAMRSSDTSIGYDVHQSRAIPARATALPSTPASRTATVIKQYLESGPKPRRELMHCVLVAGCEPHNFEDALKLLGAAESPTMFLPRVGLLMMVGLRGQRIEKRASDPPFVESRGQRHPYHLGTMKV